MLFYDIFQTKLSVNQLKRQTTTVTTLIEELEEKAKKEKEQQDQLEESQRKFIDLEGKLKEQTVRERIRDVEKAQSIAELKQVISNLEFQVTLFLFCFGFHSCFLCSEPAVGE